MALRCATDYDLVSTRELVLGDLRARIDEEMTRHGFLILFSLLLSPLVLSAADIVTFRSGDITLHGVLYKPEGPGPFPTVVYNHGSAAGMVSKSAFDALGPVFASHTS